MTEIDPNPNPTVGPLANLRRRGYDVMCTSHGEAILGSDFADALSDIEAVLGTFQIDVDEIVRGGGGETPFTQRLRRAFNGRGWTKREFVIRKLIDNVETQATSHEVDHVKLFERGTIAMEIEWNNKDPFYDRDLNNFRLLFDLRVIEVGVIVTRASNLQAIFKSLGPKVGNKYGASTTHMEKLLPRIEGGGGGGCPILAFGITVAKYVEDNAPIVEQVSENGDEDSE